MKDEIKEILDKIEIVARKHTIEVCEDGSTIETMPASVVNELRLNNYSSKVLFNYITNLQVENNFAKEYEKQYRIAKSRNEKANNILKDTNVDMPETLLIETIDYARHILNGGDNNE